MPDDAPHFDDHGRLIAPKYDDVYFSAEDGLAETRHVFLEGNSLTERFTSLKPGGCFTIGETGFGTGLNFLAAWRHFEQHVPADARLEFVSVEGLPLDPETMRRALVPWPELERHREALLQQWGPIWPGFHRFRFDAGRVRLTLLVGEAAEVLSQAQAAVDAWFLDGFAPSRNADMWSDQVFSEVARMSADDATLATYTAAGFVRRGLQAVGFEIDKQPGFGTKRDMTAGRLDADPDRRDSLRVDEVLDGSPQTELAPLANQHVIVVGGSLAGSFVARSLAERGVSVTVLEQQTLVDGQLGSLSPRVSVLQPKISDADDANGRWLREGYAIAIRLLESDARIARRADWKRTGSFQTLPNNRSLSRLRRIKSLQRFVEQFGPSGLCRWIDSEQTQDVVGLPMPCGGVVIDQAGLLRPAGLCEALLDHEKITVRDASAVRSIEPFGGAWRANLELGEPVEANAVVVCSALDALRFKQTAHLKLKPVRGQVTLLGSPAEAGPFAAIKRAVFWGGYLTPPLGGVQTLGASFVPGDSDLAWRIEEHEQACDGLESAVSGKMPLPKIDTPSGWVGLRTTTPTHRCYAERIEDGLYASLGHGSHGIASAAAAGEHLAVLINGGVRSRASR